MLKAYKIDTNGFYIEDYIYETGQELESNIITVEMPEGFIKSKWNGTQWIEGATEDYINNIKVQIEQEPTEQEKQAELINNLIVDNLNMQTQIDNLIASSLGGN